MQQSMRCQVMIHGRMCVSCLNRQMIHH
uniref:Uncharacterized protein n=1 Tax=Lotus japonicus TaxID=34305 RepID=I3SKE4_LOTJA|nr:unknown [Lotus japonicus]